MKNTFFNNKTGGFSSYRNTNSDKSMSFANNGKFVGSTMNFGKTSFRYNPTGILTSIEIKTNGKAKYFDVMGKKKNALKPY